MPLGWVPIVLNVPAEKPGEIAETAIRQRNQRFGFCNATAATSISGSLDCTSTRTPFDRRNRFPGPSVLSA
jgi:hypothetical protein